MGPCQVYGMTLIYLQGEADIQTVKKKQVPQADLWKNPCIFSDIALDYSEMNVKKCIYNI